MIDNTIWSEPFPSLSFPIYRSRDIALDAVPIHHTDIFGQLSVDLSNKTETCEIQYINAVAHCNLALANAQISIDDERSSDLSAYYMAERLVLPFMRYLRGCLLLHASALAIDDQAIALIAPSGIGKSTLVGALLANAQCAKLICDDVLTAFQSESHPNLFHAIPSQSHISMRHDMWKHAHFVDSQTEFFQKSVLKIKSTHLANTTTPIAAIVLLDKSNTQSDIVQLQPNACIAELLNSRFTISNEWPQISSYQFKSAMQCFANTPIFRCSIYDNDFEKASSQILNLL